MPAVDGEAKSSQLCRDLGMAGLATAFQMAEKSGSWVLRLWSANGFGGCLRWQEDGHVGF